MRVLGGSNDSVAKRACSDEATGQGMTAGGLVRSSTAPDTRQLSEGCSEMDGSL